MRPFRILAAVAATALLAAACGGDAQPAAGASGAAATSIASSPSAAAPTGSGVADLPADQILARAKTALKDAGSVRIAGAGGSGANRLELDIRYAGTSAQGTISTSGQPVEVRRIGSVAYIKGSQKFLETQLPGAGATLLAGKWLRTPVTDQRFGPLTQLFDLATAADGVLTPDGTVTKGERGTVAGQDAVALHTGAGAGALWIATTGQPYPLRIDEGGADAGKIAFTEYGAKVAVVPPPADQVVDVSKLGH